MMKRLTALALCLSACPVYAQDVEIEVLAFERATPAALASEVWPAQVRAPDLSRARDLSEGLEGAEASSFAQLPKSALLLTEAKQRLQRAGYRTLAHLAWRQPLSGEAVHIFGGKNLAPGQADAETPSVMESQDVLAAQTDPAGKNSSDRQASRTDPADMESTDILDAQTDPAGMAPIWQLDGWLRLSANPPLSLDSELILRLPNTQPAPAKTEGEHVLAPALAQYAFKVSRRLKFGESQYLDHPLMGLLVQVRLDTTQAPEAATDMPTTPAEDQGQELEIPLPTVKQEE